MTKQSKQTQNVVEGISELIFFIRGERVMIDRDLAELYGVTTKALNQAMKRNADRFPRDFVFQLTDSEKKELVTNCDRLSSLKHSSTGPYAFTEHGAIMLATVLNSAEAVEMSVFVVRAYIKMRELISDQAIVLKRLNELEEIVGGHDEAIISIVEAIKQLMHQEETSKRKIGFRSEGKKQP